MADVCASFQEAVVDVLVEKTLRAAERTGVRDIAIAGGVSANSALRARMKGEADRRGWRVSSPKFEYCMDNGAMIAYVGYLRFLRGITSPWTLSAEAALSL